MEPELKCRVLCPAPMTATRWPPFAKAMPQVSPDSPPYNDCIVSRSCYLLVVSGHAVDAAEALVDHGCELCLGQRVAPGHGLHALPALGEKGRQVALRLLGFHLGHATEHVGSSARRTARPGMFPCPHGCGGGGRRGCGRAVSSSGILHLADRHLLAFAHQRTPGDAIARQHILAGHRRRDGGSTRRSCATGTVDQHDDVTSSSGSARAGQRRPRPAGTS